MSDYKPGDVIPVRVGTVIIDTTIDAHGVQRFPTDSILGAWVDGTTAATDAYNKRRSIPGYYKAPEQAGARYDDENFNLNDLCLMYQKGKFTEEEWLNFYLHIGYSVSGFSDLSDFEHLEIINPVWGDSLESVHTIPTPNLTEKDSE